MKALFFLLLVSALPLLSAVCAQEPPAFEAAGPSPFLPRGLGGGEAGDVGGRDIELSANYKLSTLGFSIRYLDSESILTWRDVYLHGAQVGVELGTSLLGYDTATIGAGFSRSAHAYFVDDDANNSHKSIGVMTGEIDLMELSLGLSMHDETFSPRIGLDFDWLKIANYDLQTISRYGGTLGGLINTYDMYRLGFSGGIQAKVADSSGFYADLHGYAGLGIYLGIANWMRNPVFRHPVSFSDIGLSFRGGTEIEFGLKIARATLFATLQCFYDVSPYSGIDIQYLPGGLAQQGTFMDLFSASCGLGVKASL
jgi:hypothetical protein